jgi:hypothetical protein
MAAHDREDVDHRDAMLHGARQIRAAVRRRRTAASQALDAYDGATGDRLPEAIAFLRAIKESDHAYAEARATALEGYARRFRGAPRPQW